MPTGIYKRTKENTKNLKTFKKGHISWNKGTKGIVRGFWKNKKRPKASEITKEKMKLARAKQIITKEHRDKISQSRLGKKNPNWKGGLSRSANKIIRQSREYIFWRKVCFERDNFTCQKTKVSGGKLVVHHINNFADFPELRFEIDNGITLSEKSHKEFHKKYGSRNNTREQLLEFLTNN